MIRWKKARFESEIEEFRRITSDFVGNNPAEIKESIKYLKTLYSRENPVNLTDDVWKKLQNTGSWKVKSLNELMVNLKKDGIKRDVSRIMTQYIGSGLVNDFSGTVECPIILLAPDNKPYHYQLVAGNTRLTAARALGIRPKVIILTTDW